MLISDLDLGPIPKISHYANSPDPKMSKIQSAPGPRTSGQILTLW